MTVFSHSTALAHKTTNDTRWDDLRGQVREFGRDAASGKDALPKLAYAVVHAASDGVIDFDAKDSLKRDWAAQLYDEYVTSESKKGIHEHSAGGQKANVSKLRQLGVFGANPKFDGVQVFNDAIRIREQMWADEAKRKMMKPAYASYVDLAREQNDRDVELTESEIETLMYKSPSKVTTLEKEIEAIQKKVQKLTAGEHKDGIKDTSPELVQVEELLSQRLAALIVKREEDEEEEVLATIAERRAARSTITIDNDAQLAA